MIGLKRDDRWLYLPKKETVIKSGDVLIVSGQRARVSEVRKSV